MIKMILEGQILSNIIIWRSFRKVINGIKLVLNYGRYFYFMIDIVKEVLKDRICADYKKVLDLIDKEELNNSQFSYPIKIGISLLSILY
jgi:hypothetical protein